VRLTQEAFHEIETYVGQLRLVAVTLDPAEGLCVDRQRQFDKLLEGFESNEDPIYQHYAKVMASFEPGLFVGGDAVDLPQDNLDLERWFREPKGHERRIHGHRHAGVRIVQEGPTLLLALDAHLHHPEPFTELELRPYRRATAPVSEQRAIARRKIMRKARSNKKRSLLLQDLETRYASLS
jgi:hypothetical protein